MTMTKQSLSQAGDDLKHVLAETAAGQGEDWCRRVSQALDRMEQSLRQHRATLRDAEGRVIDVDTSTNPSPGVARRADKLHQALDKLLGEVQTLHTKLNTVHPSAGVVDPSTAAGALPVEPEVGDQTDFSVFCERAEQFVRDLEHYNEAEVQLIEDNVTLDLGAGD